MRRQLNRFINLGASVILGAAIALTLIFAFLTFYYA